MAGEAKGVWKEKYIASTSHEFPSTCSLPTPLKADVISFQAFSPPLCAQRLNTLCEKDKSILTAFFRFTSDSTNLNDTGRRSHASCSFRFGSPRKLAENSILSGGLTAQHSSHPAAGAAAASSSSNSAGETVTSSSRGDKKEKRNLNTFPRADPKKSHLR